MSRKEIEAQLFSICESESNFEAFYPQIEEEVMSKDKDKNLVKTIVEVTDTVLQLNNNKVKPITKFLMFLLVQRLVVKKSPDMVNEVHQSSKLLATLEKLAKYKYYNSDPLRGGTLFENDKEVGENLLILVLEFIAKMAESFPHVNNKPTKFAQLYTRCVSAEVTFPEQPFRYFEKKKKKPKKEEPLPPPQPVETVTAGGSKPNAQFNPNVIDKIVEDVKSSVSILIELLGYSDQVDPDFEKEIQNQTNRFKKYHDQISGVLQSDVELSEEMMNTMFLFVEFLQNFTDRTTNLINQGFLQSSYNTFKDWLFTSELPFSLSEDPQQQPIQAGHQPGVGASKDPFGDFGSQIDDNRMAAAAAAAQRAGEDPFSSFNGQQPQQQNSKQSVLGGGADFNSDFTSFKFDDQAQQQQAELDRQLRVQAERDEEERKSRLEQEENERRAREASEAEERRRKADDEKRRKAQLLQQQEEEEDRRIKEEKRRREEQQQQQQLEDKRKQEQLRKLQQQQLEEEENERRRNAAADEKERVRKDKERIQREMGEAELMKQQLAHQQQQQQQQQQASRNVPEGEQQQQSFSNQGYFFGKNNNNNNSREPASPKGFQQQQQSSGLGFGRGDSFADPKMSHKIQDAFGEPPQQKFSFGPSEKRNHRASEQYRGDLNQEDDFQQGKSKFVGQSQQQQQQHLHQSNNFGQEGEDNRTEMSFNEQFSVSNISMSGQGGMNGADFPMKLIKLVDNKVYKGVEESNGKNILNFLKAYDYSPINVKRFRLANLKRKNNVFENNFLQIGCITDLIFDYINASNYLKITVYVGNKSRMPMRNIRIQFDGDSTTYVYAKTEKQIEFLAAKTQEKFEMIVGHRSYPYGLVNMDISAEMGDVEDPQDLEASVILPNLLTKFIQFKDLDSDVYNNKWKQMEQLIQRTDIFTISKDIVKTPAYFRRFFSKILELTSLEQFVHQSSSQQYDVKYYKLGALIELADTESEYLLKLNVRPDNTLCIQIIALEQSKRVTAALLLQHLKFIFQA